MGMVQGLGFSRGLEKTGFPVSPVSIIFGFSSFLVNRNPFGFGDFGSVSGVPVRFAAFLYYFGMFF